MFNPFEIVGYIASVLVAISLMMSSVLRLRMINLAGAIFFVVYGLLIEAYPVAAVNVVIVIINLYFLYNTLTNKEYFTLLEVASDSDYLRCFLDFYREEISRYLPDATISPAEGRFIVFVLRDLVPAGLFIGRPEGEGLAIEVDFVIPPYRDFKIGRYLFHQAAFFHHKGIREMWTRPGSAKHSQYLRRMGFEQTVDQSGGELYRLSL